MRKSIVPMLVMVLAASASTALADKYGKGSAAGYQRPAMLVRAREKDVDWARTIQSGTLGHLVAWKVKGSNEVRTTLIDPKGGLITKRVTSPNGRVIGMTQNGRSAIVAIEAKGKPTQYVREKIGYGGTLPSMTRPPRLLRKYVPARFFERARAAYRRLLSE